MLAEGECLVLKLCYIGDSSSREKHVAKKHELALKSEASIVRKFCGFQQGRHSIYSGSGWIYDQIPCSSLRGSMPPSAQTPAVETR